MAWVIIDSMDAPVSNMFDFAALTLTGYKVIRLELSEIDVTTDGTDLRLTFYVAGSEVVTGYRWTYRPASSGGTTDGDQDTSDPAILLNQNNANWDTGNAAPESFASAVTIDDPTNTAQYKRANIESYHIGPTGNVIGSMGAGLMENAGAITGLKISGSSNLIAGKVRVLGLA
jgi:hypothetical protein